MFVPECKNKGPSTWALYLFVLPHLVNKEHNSPPIQIIRHNPSFLRLEVLQYQVLVHLGTVGSKRTQYNGPFHLWKYVASVEPSAHSPSSQLHK